MRILIDEAALTNASNRPFSPNYPHLSNTCNNLNQLLWLLTFTPSPGPSDAGVFRQRAHIHVGLNPAVTRAHPRLPPRFITIVDRSGLHGRGIYNAHVLMEAVVASGLPYRVLPKLDKLSFKEQVRGYITV